MSIVKLITEEQQLKNYNHYSNQIEIIKDFKQLKQLAQIVYNLQQQANGNFLFPEGKSKEFWSAYHDKKAIFEEQLSEAEAS